MTHRDSQEDVRPREALPLSVQIAYGSPAFAGAAMAIPVVVLMPHFYSDVVWVPLGTISFAIALARAFDALTDPVVGWLSDRTRSRWGRRKPWIAVGTPLAALCFWLLFAPPREMDPSAAAIWFGVLFASFFLFQTLEGVPLAALGAELTPDYAERARLFGIRSLFVALGTMVASLVPAVLAEVAPDWDERRIFSVMAGSYAAVWLLLMLHMLWRVPENPDYARRPSNPLVPGVRRALRNRPFRILLAAAIVAAIPAAIPPLLMPYYVRYVLQPPDPQRWVGIFLFVYLGTGLLCVPGWMALARRIGKLATMIVASSIGVGASVFYFFAGPGDLLYAGFVYFATGLQSMAGGFLVPAMAADVIDYDELRTGRRREAQFTAFWSIVPKFVAIPGSSVPLAFLGAVGYVPNQPQSDSVQLAIRFLYSLFPAAFYVASLAVLARYPISEAVHRRIREALGAHAAGREATDPLSGRVLAPALRDPGADEEGWFLDFFSRRELQRIARGGAAGLPARVTALAGVWLALAALGFGFAAERLAAGRSDSVGAVLGVVTAGLALTGFAFQTLRLGPARRVTRDPGGPHRARAHLARIGANGGELLGRAAERAGEAGPEFRGRPARGPRPNAGE